MVRARRYRALTGSPLELLSAGRAVVPVLVGLGAYQALYALALALLARDMGPGGFGPVASVIGIGSFLTAFLDFGSSTLAVRDIAAAGVMTQTYVRALRGRLLLSLALVALGVALEVVLASPTWQLYALLPALAAANSVELACQAPLRAKRRFWRLAASLICDRLLLVAGVTLLIISGTLSGSRAIWFLIAGSILGAVVASALWGSIDLSRFIQRPLVSALPWSGALHFGIGSAGNSVGTLDVQAIQWAVGVGAAGTYGAVARWTSAFGLLASSLTQSIFPSMASAPSDRAGVVILKRGCRAMLGPIALLLLAFVLSRWLVLVALGPGYERSVPVLRLLILALIPAYFCQLAAAFLQARGQERWTGRIVASAAVVQVGLMALVGWRVSLVAASAVPLLVQVLVLAGLVLRIRSLFAVRHEQG